VRTCLARAAGAAVLALILLLGWSTPGVRAQTFSDVQPTEWFYGPVETLASVGAVHGSSNGSFGPYTPATRAEFAYALAAVLRLAPVYGTSFVDVAPEDWFAGAVGALHQVGIVLGSSDGLFLPNADLERQQAASLIMRALVHTSGVDSGAKVELIANEEEASVWLQGFKDRPVIAAEHRLAVADAYRLGVVSGFDDGRFYPFLSVTRGQTAGILYAALFAAPPVRPEPPRMVVAEEDYPPAGDGTRGPMVAWMEGRLAALSFQAGAVDGVFDARTGEAVMAFQKVEGLERTGVATASVWARLAPALPPAPRLAAPGGRVEVDLTRQVLLLIADNVVEMTVPIASGRQGWRTPTGTFSVERKLPYWRESALGMLYKPVYFHGGFAIHGSYSVPPEPASHGCVRVSLASMDVLYPLLAVGTRVDVYY
jgi:peptidoglycan hydrolase-like protein with peptidoglycan-binding domain